MAPAAFRAGVQPTPDVPEVSFDDLYSADPTFQRLLAHWVGPDLYDALRSRMHDMGTAAATLAPASAQADLDVPTLTGDRTAPVHYCDAHAELERVGFGKGTIAVKYDPQERGTWGPHRHLVGFALGYVFAQVEPSVFCPMCMTDGVGRVLERHAPELPAAQEVLRRLASTDPEEIWQGAMFLTEQQGGSDVGANRLQARQEGDTWLLSGDKWFCSNVDAEAILALARLPGKEDLGTHTLGLFLVVRPEPGVAETIETHRLKDKLGVRSMATGEITLHDTPAYLIGGVGEGFKQMAEMLNLSRLYNAVASIGIMRRAVIEALAYGRQRKAFGRPLSELPLWRAGMADLVAESIGSTLLTFETVRALDAADNGDEDAAKRVRLLTPIAKAMTGKLAVSVTSEAMEMVGGHAYIEADSILPRLLRDAQVLPIWEGTTNILSLDLLRALREPGALPAVMARSRAAVQKGRDAFEGEAAHRHSFVVAQVLADLDELERTVDRLSQAPSADVQRLARSLLERMGRMITTALLIKAATTPDLKEVMVASAHRIVVRRLGQANVAGHEAPGLADMEQALLDAFLLANPH